MQEPKPRRYRKIATVLAYQIPEGAGESFDTLEGRVTAHHPDWRLRAYNDRSDEWPRDDAYFRGRYEETGRVVDGLKEYRVRDGSFLLAYQVDTDDHPPVTDMDRLDEPFSPPRGWWVGWDEQSGTHKRTIEPDVFATTYELAE